jgi:hypothetical protein
MRRRGFESHPVLCFLDHSASESSAHDVMEAYRPATAEARVQIPLGTLNGMEESLAQSACFGSRRSPVQIRPSRFLAACSRCSQLQTSIPVWPNGRAAPC